MALFAAEFVRRSMEFGGVEFELLISPKHVRNVVLFEDAAYEIRDRVEEIFGHASSLGLRYPYTGFSVVEVPANLRGFGGGWVMESVQALPGVMLLREHGFGLARFDFLFRELEQSSLSQQEIRLAKVAALQRYFDNDIAGGNATQAFARNLLSFQTAAAGDGAVALDFLLREIVSRLLFDSRSGYASPHALSLGGSVDAVVDHVIWGAVAGGRGETAVQVQRSVTRRAPVWEEALRRPLATLEPQDDPRLALDVLWLKAPAVAQALIDGLGRNSAGRLLSELRQTHLGRNFTATDLAALAMQQNADLAEVVGDWLFSTALPGFLVSPGTVERVDAANGSPRRYNARVHVHNGEATPGMARLAAVWAGGGGEPLIYRTSRPVLIGGRTSLELGIVTSGPPMELWVQPLLSLNRRDLLVDHAPVDETAAPVGPPLLGSRPSRWMPVSEGGIVIDDLDAGLALDYEGFATGVRVGRKEPGATERDLDLGLPTYTAAARDVGWSRQESPRAFGRYRRTTARLESPGSGAGNAVFASTLPHGGRWRLAYHLPGSGSSLFGAEADRSVYQLDVDGGGVRATVRFRAGSASAGWNNIGTFDLSGGEVRVSVSRATAGGVLFADAIRWSPEDAGG